MDWKNKILWISASVFDLVMIISLITGFVIGTASGMNAFFSVLATLGLGLFQTYNTYQNQQAQADAIEQQAKQQRELTKQQIVENSRKEQEKVDSMRDKQRRRRSLIESQYAKSGVLMDGSAEYVLTKQREKDELNVQKTHDYGNRQRSLNNWKANSNFAHGMTKAGNLRSSSKTNAVTGLIGTGINTASAYNEFGFNGKRKEEPLFDWF